MKIFESNKNFKLELGGELPSVTIAYDTFGNLNAAKDNCIWVCHALTANSDVSDWWPHTVEEGKFLDPSKHFIVCANIIGSCYGSTGPMSINPDTGEPWYDSFPRLTIRDMVNAHILLADHLGLEKIASLIGSSVGGFQAVEWAVMEPERFKSLVMIATDAYASPWTVAADETQRMAILSDRTYGDKTPDAASRGLAAARAIGMMTYRGPQGYNRTQQDQPDFDPSGLRRASTYQRYQGEKLVKRFDAYSYMTILNAFDTHSVGRGRGGVEKVLSTLKMPVLVISITTDIIFTPAEMRRLAARIDGAEYHEMESEFGHDGFLVEHQALDKIIQQFFKKHNI